MLAVGVWQPAVGSYSATSCAARQPKDGVMCLLHPGRSCRKGALRPLPNRVSASNHRLPKPSSWLAGTNWPRLRALARHLLGAALLGLACAHALDWEPGPGYRRAPLHPPRPGKTGFTFLDSLQAGVSFTNVLAPSRYLTNQIFLNGAGVAAGDVDGDGWVDLYFCGLDRPNVLYRNLGNWHFEDVTAAAGVACANRTCTGAAFGDLNGDGRLDLVVNSCGNGTFVFLNDGQGRFTEVKPGAPLNLGRGAMTVALADVDGDGDLDLYVTNYRTETFRDHPNTKLTISETNGVLEVVAMDGRPTTDPDLVGRFSAYRDGRILENGEPDVLYLNDGQAGFTPVSWTGGAFLDEDGRPLKAPPYDWGLSVMMRDINGDGVPDIYVCNDFDAPDRIWLNDGHGHFRLLPRLALRCTSIFSMGVDFADLNRDGFDEGFVSDMLSRDHAKRMLQNGEVPRTPLPIGAIADRPQYSHNTLFFNRGDGTYAELSQFAGVQASEWTWSPNFLDVDLDGYEDLLITTGHELEMMNTDIIDLAEVMKAQRQMTIREQQNLRSLFPRYSIPNALFRNRGDLTFEDVSDAWGFNHPDIGNAMAMADLDNDGDLDVAINNLNGLAELYRNDGPAPRLAVRLKGLPPNTYGVGACLRVRGGPVPVQSQQMIAGSRYLSGGDFIRTFAAGTTNARLSIEVTWRSGKVSLVTNALPDSLYEVDETAALPAPPSQPHPLDPWFEDLSQLVPHTHHEDPFDDFARQPLLPNRLSQLGPGLAWLDVDGDGWDDLVVGSGKGGRLAAFRNRGDNRFEPLTDAFLGRPVGRDQTAVLGLSGTLLVGSSNYEDGQTNGGCIRLYDFKRQATGESILGQNLTVGPLAMGDLDNDGDLDLFIGGRTVPGRHPEPADSLLMLKDGNRFVVGQRLAKFGLATGAVFTDLDGDGQPELLVSSEWGALRIFKWKEGKLQELTASLGLAEYKGWWTGVATGDLDGDGRLDIVAANWGRNSRYHPTRERPVWIHYGDLDENGTLDILESYINPATGKEVPSRGFRQVSAAMPFLLDSVPNFEVYGKATLAEIYGERLKPTAVVECNTLQTTLFLNRGDHFEARPLPAEAQWAPAFGVCVADFDGDGNEDVFLSQNFFAVNPDDWRHDAGRGLWLKGDGQGGLQPVPGQESGVKVYGEQRGAAVADYDGDGRVDLAVTQNGNATCLFHNRKAKPGLRVRLAGTQNNPHGFGAAIRLRFGERWGPLREVQGGSGYWSQNSVVQVMATPEPPSQVWVRWPGGAMTTNAVPAGAKELTLSPDSPPPAR